MVKVQGADPGTRGEIRDANRQILRSKAARTVCLIARLTLSALGTLYFLIMRGSVFPTYKTAARISFPEIRSGISAFFSKVVDTWELGFISILAPVCVPGLQPFIFTTGSLHLPCLFPQWESESESRVEHSSFLHSFGWLDWNALWMLLSTA